MKKIIKKNPIKAQKIALIILLVAFGLASFLALLAYPLIGWFCLGLTILGVYIITTSVNIQALEKKQFEEDLINAFNRMNPPADSSEVSTNEEESEN